MPRSERELLQPQEILRRMRQGQVPATAEIQALVAGIADGPAEADGDCCLVKKSI